VESRVVDLERAQFLLVTVTTDGRVRNFVVPAHGDGIEVETLHTLDLTAPQSLVRFSGLRLPAASELVESSPNGLARHLLSLASLLTVIDSVGAMERLFEFTLEYAKVREAFGRPIGSFQAVKHHLADASMTLHACMAVAAAATDALAEEHRDADEIASIAKAFVADAGIQVAQTCLQVHGGIGYAWEHDLHLYLRRLAANAALFGDAGYHRAQIAALHGLGGVT
jgi:alkylation response protein AidB-like acyl-CoA dehydrogenase